jgi:hypothetical protein
MTVQTLKFTRTSIDIPWYENFYATGTPERTQFDYYMNYFGSIPDSELVHSHSEDLLIGWLTFRTTDFDIMAYTETTPDYQDFMNKVFAYYASVDIDIEIINE